MEVSLDLKNLDGDGKTYIILNPERPPYIIHSRSPYWDRATINLLLRGYHIFKPVNKEVIEASEPSILACGEGFSIYIHGKAVDKLKGGVFTYSLVKSMIDGSLDGSGLKRVDLSITNPRENLIRAVFKSFKPIAIVSGIGYAINYLQSYGFRVVYPEGLYRRLKLSMYLRDRYGILGGSEGDIASKLEAIYGGRSFPLCIGMYRGECDLTVLEDISALDGVSHVSIYPDMGRISLKLFI